MLHIMSYIYITLYQVKFNYGRYVGIIEKPVLYESILRDWKHISKHTLIFTHSNSITSYNIHK